MYFSLQRTLICLVSAGLLFSQLLQVLGQAPAGQVDREGEGLDLFSFWGEIKNKVNELGGTVNTIVEDVGSSPILSEVKNKANQLGGTVNTIVEDVGSSPIWSQVKNKANELGGAVNTIVEDVGSSQIWSEVKDKANELGGTVNAIVEDVGSSPIWSEVGDTVNTIVEDVGSSPLWSEVKNKANELGDTVNTVMEDVGSSWIWSEIKDKANEIGINKLLNETIPEVQIFITSLQKEITSILDSQVFQNLRSELESLNPNLNFSNSESSDSNEFFIKFENEFQIAMDSYLDVPQWCPEQGFGSNTSADICLDSQAPKADFEGLCGDRKVEIIGAFVDVVEEVLVKVTKEFGLKEEQTRERFTVVKPAIRTTLIIIVCLICFLQQRPWLLWVLGFVIEYLLCQIFPLNIILIILRILGFGILGPVKGSLAAWAQSFFFGPAVPKGSWFAIFQKIGMKGMTC